MTKKLIKRASITLIALLMMNGFVLSLATTVDAQNQLGRAEEKLEQARQKQQNLRLQHQDRVDQIKSDQASKSAELQLRRAANQERIQEKLAGVKLEACQQRQDLIARHTTKISERSENLLQKIDSIATKAAEFKVAKGISAEGLEDLELDIDESKQAVEIALEAATTSAVEFDCTSDGPKAQLQQFVEAMDLVRDALKNYRGATHEYIQAIRQANGLNRDEEASSSATPSPTSQATDSAEEVE